VEVPRKLSSDQERLVKELLSTLQGEGAAEDEGFLAKMFGSDKGRKKGKKRK